MGLNTNGEKWVYSVHCIAALLAVMCTSPTPSRIKSVTLLYQKFGRPGVIGNSDLNILTEGVSYNGASHDSYIWNCHPIKNHLELVLLTENETL
ncbi:hypothetical protein SFRURICE_006424 [Spodoptera frugiperda]|uniref:SFRICE_011836 n=1 Tax=Spodoptera frugiperda TaxID=7108 RepID=A0A2H1WFL7_SPOFR|nr:hypothetical protein SFRURICE_006424 [Spodoptera frugiperda]